ncbi:MAG: hypothetical protein JOZ29_07915 [Deltaproteobacteria bacterium]|nr:hypothetical protein [Deltaproteobacteria bacterium]
MRGRLEGLAIAGGESRGGTASGTLHTNGFAEPAALQTVRTVVGRCGATYVCALGEMQSPPLEWPHGGGEFIRMFTA